MKIATDRRLGVENVLGSGDVPENAPPGNVDVTAENGAIEIDETIRGIETVNAMMILLMTSVSKTIAEIDNKYPALHQKKQR